MWMWMWVLNGCSVLATVQGGPGVGWGLGEGAGEGVGMGEGTVQAGIGYLPSNEERGVSVGGGVSVRVWGEGEGRVRGQAGVNVFALTTPGMAGWYVRGSLYFGEEDGRGLVSPRLEPGVRLCADGDDWACPVLSVPVGVDLGGGERRVVVGVLLGIGVAHNLPYSN